MFPPGALGHVFELLQMRTQSNLSSCPKESEVRSALHHFAGLQAIICLLASCAQDAGMEFRGWQLCCLPKYEGLCGARTNYETVYHEETLSTRSPHLLQERPTLTSHLKVNDNFCVACNWIEMATAWATCFSEETVVLEEDRSPSSGTTQKWMQWQMENSDYSRFISMEAPFWLHSTVTENQTPAVLMNHCLFKFTFHWCH